MLSMPFSAAQQVTLPTNALYDLVVEPDYFLNPRTQR
jgi:hypothetical protein